jgi:hypothetical protein
VLQVVVKPKGTPRPSDTTIKFLQRYTVIPQGAKWLSRC